MPVTVSARLTEKQHKLLNDAALKVGWSAASLARRAMIKVSAEILACDNDDLGNVMTPLIVLEVENQ